MLWSWSKKLHNMERIIYSWYVSGGTIKIRIHKNGDYVSVTHTRNFEVDGCPSRENYLRSPSY